VVSVVPSIKPVKASEVGLAFTGAQCGDMKMGPFNLLLSAIAAPPEDSDLGIKLQLAGSGHVGCIRAGRFSIVCVSAMIVLAGASPEVYLFPLIPRMEMGDVYHIKGLKLSVGTGPENSSILTSKDHDVSLEKHSLLLLVPAQWTIARASGEPGTAQPESGEPAARIPAVARDRGGAAAQAAPQ
jgi:hypothetical protein